MSRTLTVPIGVVVARESVEHCWPDSRWRAVDLLLDPPTEPDWLASRATPQFARHHAATLPLRLHAKDVTSYRVNLSNGVPSVYIVMGDQGVHAGSPFNVRCISASSFEVQGLARTGFDVIERLAMPEALVRIVSRFIDEATSAPADARPYQRRAELLPPGALSALPAK
jgi:hypothetical protein